MKGTAGTVGLDQAAPLPKFPANVLLCDPVDPYRQRELCGGEDLCLDTAYCADDVEKSAAGSRLQEEVSRDPSRADLRPGKPDQ